MSRIEYHDPYIYLIDSIDMVLFPRGYATISGSTVTFHYYTQDYLGNPTTGQPYKFGGKELLTTNGLN